MDLATAAVMDQMPVEELQKRAARWRFFQIIFVVVYVGVVLDVITTALGYVKAGSQYEQNPLGGSLIGHLGWIGLLALLTVLCGIAYHSVRVVAWRMAPRWTKFINVVMVGIAAFRWLAVVTAVLYLLQAGK
jgi:hypothetical protein